MVLLLRRLRVLWLAAGVVSSLLGIFGIGLGWGDSTTRVASAAPPPASPTTQPAPSSSAPGATSPPHPRPERPAAFFARFEDAVRSGDRAFLTQRLHPDVITRYGRAQCRHFVPDLTDPTAKLQLERVTGPAVYAYASDGRSTSVPGTYTFHVTGTAAGTTGPRTYHFALVAGQFRSFADCGTPRR